MSKQPTQAPTVQSEAQVQKEQPTADPVEVLARELGQEAGVRIGNALAREIHEDPEVRRAVATGAGVGLGVVVGLGLLALATQ